MLKTCRPFVLALWMTACWLGLLGCAGEAGNALDTENSTIIEPNDPADPGDPGNNTVVAGVDSDGDGFTDEEEINGVPGTDPNDPTDSPDHVRDSDGDGCSDFDELNFADMCDNDPDSPSDPDDPSDPEDPADPPDDPVDPSASYGLAGALRVSDSAVVDGDTADPLNTVVDNNAATLDAVQALPNPCTLGGFLGTGAQGADTTDAYRVQMAGGQVATLLLADPDANDFDLFLYDDAGQPIASSEGVGQAEQVTAPAGGTYIVQVYGYSVVEQADAGGLYTLLIGTAAGGGQMAARDRLSSLYPHQAGEVLVAYEPGAAVPMLDTIPAVGRVEVINHAEQSGGVERLRVVASDDEAGRPVNPPAETALARPTSAAVAAAKALRRRAGVAYADPNYLRSATAVPNDEFYSLQWHYDQIHLPAAWDVTTGEASVIVAVIDTGVVLSHPDLQGQLVVGYDFISDAQMARDGDGIDANADDPGDLGISGSSSSFHGTHVAGTIAAATDNSTGVAGIAWNAKIMPIRVLGVGGGLDFDIVQGILYAAGLENASGTLPDQRADVINLSLGGEGYSESEEQAIAAARAQGVIVIAAAGNESTTADYSSPAGLQGVVTVSAVDYLGQVAPYSNYGSVVNVAAPGGDVASDANGDSYPDGVLSTLAQDDGSFIYDFFQGTSMATPHVAGVAALMRSVHPGLSPEDFDLLLAGEHPGTSIAIVDDLGTAGWDKYYGYGLINALGAVQAAAELAGTGTTIDTPILQVSPSTVNLGTSGATAEITVRNGGVGTLTVTEAASDAEWLSVSPASGGAGTYTLTASRSDLSDGVYTATVRFTSDGGDAGVSVRLDVGSTATTGDGDVGTVYVLLIDPEAFATLDQSVTTAADGYAFAFSDVPEGTYALFGGTDLNNDGFIDDEGEAVGGYPLLGAPQLLEVNRDRDGLSFDVSYDLNVQAPASSSQTNEEPRLQRLDVR